MGNLLLILGKLHSMAIELYGIRQNLGICEELSESDYIDIPDIQNIDSKKYKEFKKFTIKGGVEVFRGMADANLLANISISIEVYQRKTDSQHKEKLKQYLLKSNPDRIYFPEVTLLYKYDDTVAPETLAIQSIINDYKNSDIDLLAKLYATGISVLTLQEDEKLERLDGNHRLTVLEEFSIGTKKNNDKKKTSKNIHKENRMLSYCIILVPKTQHFTYEHLYFYLLNSKSLPITPQKNIDLLIDDINQKYLSDFIKQDPFLSIMSGLKNYWKDITTEEKESLIKIVQEIILSPNKEIQNKIKDQQIITLLEQGIGIYYNYKMNSANCQEQYVGVCCLIRIHTENTQETTKQLQKFQEWMQKLQHDITHFMKISDLYESFKKHLEYISKTKYIFVAMQYDDEYIRIYTNAIKNSIMSIKGRYPHINLELLEIMNPNDGDNIINNIMERDIPKCDIFIADFSTNNGNVLLEYGYAKALNKFMCLLYSKNWRNETLRELKACDLNTNSSVNKVYNDLEHKIFDLRVIKNTEWDSNTALEELLKERFDKYIIENNLDLTKGSS